MPAWYTVYSPVTGYCTSRLSDTTYCTGGAHPIVGGTGYEYPLVIGFQTPGRQLLDFIGSTNIYRIKTIWRAGIVCADSPGGGIDDALEIEMYSGQNGDGTFIGKILYAHAYHDNPVNGTYNTYVSGNRRVVTGLAWQPIGSHTCYQGIHTHFEAKYAYSANSSIGSCSGSCSGYPCVTYGSTWIYEWYQ